MILSSVKEVPGPALLHFFSFPSPGGLGARAKRGRKGFPENQLVVPWGIGIEDPGLLFISLLAVQYAGVLVDRRGGGLNK